MTNKTWVPTKVEETTDKGQTSQTINTGTGSGYSTGTVTDGAKTDMQTAKEAVFLNISFTVPFRAQQAVTPTGEIEPGPSC